MSLVEVGEYIELEDQQRKCIRLGGIDIALLFVNTSFYAIENVCPHEGGPVGEGEINGQKITCPWHGAVFDIENGALISGPAEEPLRCFPILKRNGRVFVELP
jgi:3-phenylpropionate/trans-cinnamate dioxygenase ferredoxin subunit